MEKKTFNKAKAPAKKRSITGRNSPFAKKGEERNADEVRAGKQDNRYAASAQKKRTDEKGLKKGKDAEMQKGKVAAAQKGKDAAMQKGKVAATQKGKDAAAGKKAVRKSPKLKSPCPVEKKCGGCQYLTMDYQEQLKKKQKEMETLLKPYCRVMPIIGMDDPYNYRNKVTATFGHKRDGSIISGKYEEKSHKIVPVDDCLIEDKKADAIIRDIRGLMPSFKMKSYNEDSGYGLVRHVLVRTGKTSGQIMVVLVLSSPILPGKNNFVKALRKLHPEITTIVINVNNQDTSMILGDRESVIYGKGYIEDQLCGKTFRISSKSFYQINPVQTEKLYNKAIQMAGLTGKERVIDAYCGIGTIGLVAADHAKEVIGVELNGDAVRDAMRNAKANGIENTSFYNADAGEFMEEMADEAESADVVFMDPPRSGSTEQFMKSAITLGPKKIVYVSCGPETLARDLKYLTNHGYRAVEAWPVDMFPHTVHCENVVLLKKNRS